MTPASSAATTIGRILDLFPQEMHGALRSAIAFNMRGIIAQKLLKSIKPGVGRVPTVEMTCPLQSRMKTNGAQAASMGVSGIVSGRDHSVGRARTP
jgi:Tfp pilus assembly ATPase PilU